MISHPAWRTSVQSVDAAAIFYFGKRPGATTADRTAIRTELGHEPFISSLAHTRYGTGAIITLPLTIRDLLRDRAGAIEHVTRAVSLAKENGARCVSLSGLLPAISEYGQALGPSRLGVAVTTGHATVTACMILAIRSMLGHSGRSWRQETVAILGTGSIGASTLLAALHLFGVPRQVVACDISSNRSAVDALGDSLRETYAGIDFVFCATDQDDRPLYRASLVVGSTSVPNCLDVYRLRPGCMIVDDSVPHCFDVAAGAERATKHGDILFTYGGTGLLRETFDLVHNPPDVLVERAGWPRESIVGQELPGCILSPLAQISSSKLATTTGKGAAPAEVQLQLEFMASEQIESTRLQIGGFIFDHQLIDRFRNQFQLI
jgi:hypothetical protein